MQGMQLSTNRWALTEHYVNKGACMYVFVHVRVWWWLWEGEGKGKGREGWGVIAYRPSTKDYAPGGPCALRVA